MTASGGPAPERFSTRRAARGRRRVLVRVLVLSAALTWGLVAWQALVPPVPVPVPPLDIGDMVLCAGGTLVTEVPPASVVISAFWIDRFEVTREDWGAFLLAHPAQTPPQDWGGARLPPPGLGDLPVTYVSLLDARAYAAWRGKRLPTAAEWERAAVGGTDQRYPWGDLEAIGIVANTRDAGFPGPTPVGLFESGRSPSGAYDMVGNVDEWTETPAPGLFSDRWFTRGGSFQDTILETDRTTTIMDTHRWVEGAEGGSWQPRAEKLQGARSFAKDRGFRCARDAAGVERERRVRDLMARLGGRDPVRWVRDVRPAEAELVEIGAPALPVIRHALALVADESVRERLAAIVAGIEESSR